MSTVLVAGDARGIDVASWRRLVEAGANAVTADLAGAVSSAHGQAGL